LALAAVAGVAALALQFARGGFSQLEVVVTVLLLAAPAVLLLFVAGLRELAGLPERLLRLPQRSGEHLTTLAGIAAEPGALARAGGGGDYRACSGGRADSPPPRATLPVLRCPCGSSRRRFSP